VALTEFQPADNGGRLSLAGLPGRVGAWLADDSHSSIAQRVAGTAFLIRVFSAGLIYLSQIALARWMGSYQFGIYVYVWTWVVLVGSLSPLGIGYLAQRLLPEYTAKGDDEAIRGFLLGSRLLCLGLGSSAALAGAALLYVLGDRLPAYYVVPFTIGLACLPVFALSCAQDSIARAHNWIGVALVPAYIAQPILTLVAVAAIHFAGLPAEANAAVLVVTTMFWVAVLSQSILLQSRLARRITPGPRRYEVRRWIHIALPVFFVESFYLLLTHTDILVLQLYVASDRIAVYYAAVKTMALVAFIYFAVSAACAHRFSEYHVAGDRERLSAFVRDATRWTFWPSLAMTAVLFVLGKPILMLFGRDFAAGYPLICILAVGLMARASVGPAERLLTMLGQQGICAVVYATAFLVNVALCVALIPHLGLTGAAISTAIALTLESILLFWVARRRLGLHVFILGPRAVR
jgi:O-antigen/teichoic acid export membrane protein